MTMAVRNMNKIVAVGLRKTFSLKKNRKGGKNIGDQSTEIDVLNSLNLSVREGEFLVLVGPSGSGKSVLLDILGGLTKPTGGTVYLDDKPVTGPSRKTAYVFQQYALFPWRTAQSNVEFGMENLDIPANERSDRARELLHKFGLKGFEDRFPYQLSGGMQQRVAIARALAIKPEVLLMDEPFAALDAQTRELLQDELIYTWEQGERTTVIFVTHSIDEAVFLADRVAVITARPAEIKEVIDIDLPRPRTAESRSSCEFVERYGRRSSLK